MQILLPLLATNGTNLHEFFHELLPQAAIMNQLRLFIKPFVLFSEKSGQAVANQPVTNWLPFAHP